MGSSGETSGGHRRAFATSVSMSGTGPRTRRTPDTPNGGGRFEIALTRTGRTLPAGQIRPTPAPAVTLALTVETGSSVKEYGAVGMLPVRVILFAQPPKELPDSLR